MMQVNAVKRSKAKPQVGDFVYAEWQHVGGGFYQIQKINSKFGLRHIDGVTYAFFSNGFTDLSEMLTYMNTRLRKWDLYSQDEYEMHLLPKGDAK
ncbi:hypothetical protein [Bacillus sp. SN10]|uniref:hypothetical protein n=1 Tax=Bacillus sp. SN10 TaxID=2056493 RepID=UPI000C3298AC|nr:hypothetical protein [Bacillus sp. SN10]PKJ52637.1 hypothetical protein CWE34_26305 [Bacillus sp. SN10]